MDDCGGGYQGIAECHFSFLAKFYGFENDWVGDGKGFESLEDKFEITLLPFIHFMETKGFNHCNYRVVTTFILENVM